MAGFRSFLNSGHSPTLFASFLYFAFSCCIWVLNGAMAPFISETFNLSPAQKGLMLSIPILAGALMRFLAALHPGWNISLFHYRNQGADYGRILVGIQVPASDGKAFDGFVRSLAYPHVEETHNPVYRLFLR